QAAGFMGAMKRLAPAVDAPYGTPQNWLTPYRTRPRIFPAVVATAAVVGSPLASCASTRLNEPPTKRPAVAIALRPRNERRSISDFMGDSPHARCWVPGARC